MQCTVRTQDPGSCFSAATTIGSFPGHTHIHTHTLLRSSELPECLNPAPWASDSSFCPATLQTQYSSFLGFRACLIPVCESESCEWCACIGEPLKISAVGRVATYTRLLFIARWEPLNACLNPFALACASSGVGAESFPSS